jgi:DNA replication protein DnaC
MFIPKRNEPNLNTYNRLIIEHWRANIDLQPITSTSTNMIYYICKYIVKSESRSNFFNEFLNDFAISQTETDKTVFNVLREAVLKMLCERDYSSQEVMFILDSIPYYHCSRNFVNVNLLLDDEDEDEDVVFLGNTKTIAGKINKEKNSKNKKKRNTTNENNTISSVPIYCDRPKEFEHYNMHEFFSTCTKSRNGWKKLVRAQPRILRIFPKNFNKDKNLECKQKLLLNVPFRDVKDLCCDNDWIKACKKFNLYVENVESDVKSDVKNDVKVEKKLIEIDNELGDQYENERLTNPNKNIDENASSKKSENKPQWQQISDKLPHIKNVEKDLGDRDFDHEFDFRENYFFTNKEIEEMKKFLEDCKMNFKHILKTCTEADVEFNENQNEIITQFDEQLEATSNNKKHKIMRTIVQGKAGTGKSTIINYMTNRLIKHHSFGPKSFLLLAPTGVAAVNVEGSTVHSKLKFCDLKAVKLNGTVKAQMQNDLEKCKFLILDEFSMVGCKLLSLIDQRLRELFEIDLAFGGLYVYFFGDIKQITPVKDRALFRNEFSKDAYLQAGRILYLCFDKAFYLEKICRQEGDDQKNFRKLLNNVSDYKIDDDDFRLLISRHECKLAKEEKDLFKNAIRLYCTNNEVDKYNKTKLKELEVGCCKILARDTPNKFSKEFPFEKGLPYSLTICKNALIMLRVNLWTENGLVNGSLGIVRGILFKENEKPPDFEPEIILVEFINYKGPTYKDTNFVPICRIKMNCGELNKYFIRYQFPLTVSFATTIHKSQGLTLPLIVIDFGDKEIGLGCYYVALSRVRQINHLLIQGEINIKQFNKYEKKKNKIACDLVLNERVEDELRLRKGLLIKNDLKKKLNKVKMILKIKKE